MPIKAWQKYAYVTVALVAIIIFARIYQSYVVSQFETALKQQLEIALIDKTDLLTQWSTQLKSSARIFVSTISSDISQGQFRIEGKSADLAPDLHKRLVDWFSQSNNYTPFSDFLLIDRLHILASLSDSSASHANINALFPDEFLARLWQGEIVVTLPHKIDIAVNDSSGRVKSDLISQFVGIPIFNLSHTQVIAAILLRLDPTSFSNLFAYDNQSVNHESFAFDRRLQLLSESQHNLQMRQHGKLTDTNSLGNVKINLPNINDKLSAELKAATAGNVTYNTSTYVNYLGNSVIGAWEWLPSWNMGIAVELNAAKVLKPLNIARSTIHVLAFVLLLVTGAMFYLLTIIQRNRRMQAYLPSLLDAGTEAILSTDHNGTIVYTNRRVCELLGYSVDELLNQNIDMLLPESLRELHLRHRREFMENPQQRPMGKGLELHAQHKNGDIVLIEVGLTPVQQNYFKGVTVSLRDVSVQQKLQYELSRYRGQLNQLVEKRTAELEASRKELESYSYTIAHDLRAPLRAITGYSQLLIDENELQLPGERQDALNRIVQAGKRMADMIDDILELSRITRKDIKYENVNLSALVEHSIERIKKKNPNQKIKFIIEPDLTVSGDKSLLSLVIDNLIENACKYTRLNPISVVEFGMHRHKEVDAYYIRDNGIGFDMAYRHDLFKPFYRLHARELYEGEGIGLATAQRIIHRHGGRIWANSEKNAGSTFYFTVPDVHSIDSTTSKQQSIQQYQSAAEM